MDFRYVRVEVTDLANPTAPIFIDLLRDDDGQVKDGPPYAGWWGNHKSTEVWPFVTKKIDGAYMLDFGSDATTSQNERYELFNLLVGKLQTGNRFKQKFGNDWYSFRVSRIVDMMTGKEL